MHVRDRVRLVGRGLLAAVLLLVAGVGGAVPAGAQTTPEFRVDARVVEVTTAVLPAGYISPLQPYEGDNSGGPINPVVPQQTYGAGVPSLAASLDPNSLSGYDPTQPVPTGPGPVIGTTPPHGSRVGGISNGGTTVTQATIAVRVTLNGQPVPGAQVSLGLYQFPPTDADGVSVGAVLFPNQASGVQGGTIYAAYQSYQATTDVYLPH